MKYCPKCGAELADDAAFCVKCGAQQPGFEKPQATEPALEPVPAPAPTPVTQKPEESPRQRFDRLMVEDEKFKTIVTTTRKVNLLALINLAFIIPMLVNFFTPVAMFTGREPSSNGIAILDALGYRYPIEFSAMSIYKFKTLAKPWPLGPGSLPQPFAMMLFIFSWVFVALFVVIAVVGSPRSYLLKTYEEGKEAELIKSINSPMKHLFGSVLAFLSLFAAITTYIQCDDIKYVYDDSSRWIFGEIAAIDGSLIGPIMVTIIFITAMIVSSFVVKSFMTKKLRQMLAEKK